MMYGLTDRRRVLVVEDEALVAMLIADVVEDANCNVVGPVGDLDKALRAASIEPLSAAILDINIRGGCRFPIAKQLLARAIPFILCSAYPRATLPSFLVDQRFLAKPFILGDLAKMILTMINEPEHLAE